MYIVSILLVLPVLFTGVLLMRTHMDVAKVATDEIRGAQQLTHVWKNLTAGAKGEAADAKAVAALTDLTQAHDGILTTAQVNSMRDSQDLQLVTTANSLFIQAVDRSGLILDPEFQSFYVMDAITVKLPATLVGARNLADMSMSGRDPVGLRIAIASLTEKVTATHTGLQKSGVFDGGSDEAAQIRDRADIYKSAAMSFATSPSQESLAGFVAASDRLFEVGNARLMSLVEARRQTAWVRMTWQTGAAAAVMLLALIMTLTIGRGLSRRLTVLSDLMARLTRGENVGSIPYQTDRHETGVIVKTLEAFKINLAETDEMRLNQHRLEEESITQRRVAMLEMADQFETSIMSVVEELSHSAQRLGQTATELSVNAQQASARSQAVAQSMDAASANIQSVAGATEEMSASSYSIADQAKRSAAAAEVAAARAQDATAKVVAMNEAANSIGSSIDMISSITSQTNLLALNATIEAARAGEAGRGFSVVATEVKALAQQTAKVTEEISEQVRSVQDTTAEAAEAITAIADMVAGLRDISTAIAASVNQQTAAVGEISRSTAEVALSTADVGGAIGEVSETASRTGYQATSARSDVERLAAQTEALKATASAFLTSVRAA